jgi:hypothetical protein
MRGQGPRGFVRPGFGRGGEATDMGPVFRAMTNLMAVLQQKALDSANKEQLFAVAEIIDEAARKIERL